MGNRHIIIYNYTVSAFKEIGNFDFDDKKIDLNTNEWTDKSPEGLAKFVKQKIPNWKKIVVTKYKIIIDPAKKSGSQVISKKTKDLTIVNKNCSSSLSIKVNSDLTNDGKIPLHIYKFFGKDGR